MVQCRGKRRSGTVGSVCLVPAEWKRVSLTVRSESLFSASSQVRRRHAAKAKFLFKGNFGLWSVYVPPSSLGPVGSGFRGIVPGTISRGSLGFLDRLPAERGPGTG